MQHLDLECDQELYLECACHSHEHLVKISVDIWEEFDQSDIYLSYFIASDYLPFYKRWWYALKYAFGRKQKYGHFDVTTLKDKDVVKLRDLLTEYVDKFITPKE